MTRILTVVLAGLLFSPLAQATGLDPLTASLEDIYAVLQQYHHMSWQPPSASREACLDLLVSTVVAVQNPPTTPLYITHFPREQASLAKYCEEDARFALRFELYYGDIELANGFEELNDPVEQARRFALQAAQRKVNGQAAIPVDQRFLHALEAMPACSGVALGLDRLLMILLGSDSLDAVQSFSWGRV